ncbi:MAG: hypothetical protein SOR73_13295 [Romboutsia timonensis]|uniref:hypothetical protein n=1 Tax=Romboutsia timonensis TaxID=1776391 RepID=UPI002A74C3C6|nr:hypothetical protein [Romboutsia timonensis]MDY3002630.1 hypothetical protein [Romboutsia timonensis]
MKKLKSICKYTLSYIESRILLRYSIIVVIILLFIGIPLTNKYLNIKTNNVEELYDKELYDKEVDKDVTKGTISTDVIDDIEYSRHTLGNGFSTLPDEDNSNLNNSNQSNISTNKLQNADKSLISGIDLEILEGHEFNPKKDLKLQAIDKDGSDITENIIIEKNTVNTKIPGIYTVKASVRLSSGQSKEKEFTVIVKETKLDVSLESFRPIKTNVKKGENIGFEVDLKVSKKHINPVAVMLNGQEYTLYKGNENIIDVLTNKKNYKVFINAEDTSGIYEYNLEHVKMSNGAWITLGQNIQTLEVLKDEASIRNFSYEEKSKEKKIDIKFNLIDLDNTTSNLILEFYKDDNLLETMKLDKMQNYLISLPTNSNGIYNLKILSDISLNQNINEDNIIFNKEIFRYSINISNIDQTSLTGNDIEIVEGDTFDAIKDLSLKATDVDGEDITDKINVNSKDIDINKIDKQSIVASVTNKNGEIYTKEFYVTVKKAEINNFSLSRILFGNYNNKIENTNSKASSNKTILIDENKPLTHNIDVTGIVNKSDGSLPDGKIEIELPTSISFSVNAKGELISGVYTIKNNSNVGVSLSVSKFVDTTSNKGITIRPIGESLSNLDRSNLHLALIGDNNKYADLGKVIDKPIEILNLKPLDSSTIFLRGEAGKVSGGDIDKNGASDKFTLVFRISKN